MSDSAPRTTGSAPPREDRFVDVDRPRTSPSGQFTAKVDFGPEQNGVRTWIVAIEDTTGTEVFRDDYAYSTRHGAGITWLSTKDQLWIISSDVGTAHVDRAADGRWTKTAIYPETVGDIPEEIQRYRSR